MKSLVMAMGLVLFAALVLAPLSAGGKQESDTANKQPSTTQTKTEAYPSGFDLTGMAMNVQPYMGEKAAMEAAAGGKTVVYFFTATWCPGCQSTYQDLKANGTQLPKDLQILYVNYDKQTDLKTKFGITAQHTWVSINAKGEKIKSWAGSMKVADIAMQASGK